MLDSWWAEFSSQNCVANCKKCFHFHIKHLLEISSTSFWNEAKIQVLPSFYSSALEVQWGTSSLRTSMAISFWPHSADHNSWRLVVCMLAFNPYSGNQHSKFSWQIGCQILPTFLFKLIRCLNPQNYILILKEGEFWSNSSFREPVLSVL
jgi:hypothetical protein